MNERIILAERNFSIFVKVSETWEVGSIRLAPTITYLISIVTIFFPSRNFYFYAPHGLRRRNLLYYTRSLFRDRSKFGICKYFEFYVCLRYKLHFAELLVLRVRRFLVLQAFFSFLLSFFFFFFGKQREIGGLRTIDPPLFFIKQRSGARYREKFVAQVLAIENKVRSN